MNITLCISEAEVSPGVKDLPDETWIVANADSANFPVPTSTFNLNLSKNIDSTVQLPVDEKNAKHMYVYFTLCTYGSARDEVLPIARTKTKFSNLPLDGCSQFKLQLFDSKNSKSQVMTISMIGTFTPSQSCPLIEASPGTNTYIF